MQQLSGLDASLVHLETAEVPRHVGAPNLARPTWVDVEPDLNQHLDSVKLPKSAKTGKGMAALPVAVGNLQALPLDRSRPLWKFFVLEGLTPSADGHQRIGRYPQFHPAVDGNQTAVGANGAVKWPRPARKPVSVAARQPEPPAAAKPSRAAGKRR